MPQIKVLRGGYNIDLQNVDSSFTKLHKAVYLNNEQRAIKYLKQFNVNALDSYKRTPLHFAAVNGNLRIIKQLLIAGAHINIQDGDGRTPLIKAIECGHNDVVLMLMDRQPNIDLADFDQGNTAVHHCLLNSNVDAALFIIRNALIINYNKCNHRKESYLHLAAKNPNLIVVIEELIANGIDIDAKDELGRTASEIAKQFNNNNSYDLIEKYVRAKHSSCSMTNESLTNNENSDYVNNDSIDGVLASAASYYDNDAIRKRLEAQRIYDNLDLRLSSNQNHQQSTSSLSPTSARLIGFSKQCPQRRSFNQQHQSSTSSLDSMIFGGKFARHSIAVASTSTLPASITSQTINEAIQEHSTNDDEDDSQDSDSSTSSSSSSSSSNSMPLMKTTSNANSLSPFSKAMKFICKRQSSQNSEITINDSMKGSKKNLNNQLSIMDQESDLMTDLDEMIRKDLEKFPQQIKVQRLSMSNDGSSRPEIPSTPPLTPSSKILRFQNDRSKRGTPSGPDPIVIPQSSSSLLFSHSSSSSSAPSSRTNSSKKFSPKSYAQVVAAGKVDENSNEIVEATKISIEPHSNDSSALSFISLNQENNNYRESLKSPISNRKEAIIEERIFSQSIKPHGPSWLDEFGRELKQPKTLINDQLDRNALIESKQSSSPKVEHQRKDLNNVSSKISTNIEFNRETNSFDAVRDRKQQKKTKRKKKRSSAHKSQPTTSTSSKTSSPSQSSTKSSPIQNCSRDNVSNQNVRVSEKNGPMGVCCGSQKKLENINPIYFRKNLNDNHGEDEEDEMIMVTRLDQSFGDEIHIKQEVPGTKSDLIDDDVEIAENDLVDRMRSLLDNYRRQSNELKRKNLENFLLKNRLEEMRQKFACLQNQFANNDDKSGQKGDEFHPKNDSNPTERILFEENAILRKQNQSLKELIRIYELNERNDPIAAGDCPLHHDLDDDRIDLINNNNLISNELKSEFFRSNMDKDLIEKRGKIGGDVKSIEPLAANLESIVLLDQMRNFFTELDRKLTNLNRINRIQVDNINDEIRLRNSFIDRFDFEMSNLKTN
ncbi:ankyrin repeat domain containing protein 38 [Sarcoptes scabiei]|uniref:Ankyrin repeat domain containing protein 38 n=1 Tax=Sarcoptes scabiei TaxID=52283 RepID=A0A132ALX1_SARSC|nr:ankyrin repeat domain containing protein 38 [Sarcoptes scabiei]